MIQRRRTKYLERFKSELGLSISVNWVFSVCQVSKLGQEKICPKLLVFGFLEKIKGFKIS